MRPTPTGVRTLRTVPAVRLGDRWFADTNLGGHDIAAIRPGSVRDTWGEINGTTLTTARYGTSPSL